jgi:hypothetical protein
MATFIISDISIGISSRSRSIMIVIRLTQSQLGLVHRKVCVCVCVCVCVDACVCFLFCFVLFCLFLVFFRIISFWIEIRGADPAAELPYRPRAQGRELKRGVSGGLCRAFGKAGEARGESNGLRRPSREPVIRFVPGVLGARGVRGLSEPGRGLLTITPS